MEAKALKFVYALLVFAIFLILASTGEKEVLAEEGMFIPPTLVPTALPTSTPLPGMVLKVRVSHYWPPLGPPNCGEFVNGVCISRLASNLPWEDWVGKAIACPPEWPFWTIVVIEGREWICLDRGTNIVFEDGVPWIDMLTPQPLFPFGKIVEARVIFGEE